MLLLIGPPGSGKTSFCLDLMRQSFREGSPERHLFVPTTTLAEHLRNQLARERFVFSPRRVSTFGEFVASITPHVTQVTSPALEILCGELLDKLDLARYERVRRFPGFRSALVHAIQEFAGAGGTLGQLESAGADPDFLQVFSAVLDELRARGQCLRRDRLVTAADRIGQLPCPASILVSGFFLFTPPEIEVLRALDRRSELIVTFTPSDHAHPTLSLLRSFATDIRTFDPAQDSCTRSLHVAPTLDGEAIEVARQILAERASGRLFREIGVVVRSEQPYVPALRAAFERFGIPARFYFAPPLSSDPTIRFFAAIVGAMLSGWDHEKTLTALRMHGSPLEQTASGDTFDHEVRLRLPGIGLDGLREVTPQWSHSYLAQLDTLAAWRDPSSLPAVWYERFLQLPALFRPTVASARISHEDALMMRAQATAIEHFQACIGQARDALSHSRTVSCGEFWSAVQIALNCGTLRLIDRRRDVVHVIDAVEARQWRLPVVFACGLLEGDFPKYISEDPILPDAVRQKLQRSGVPIRTSPQRQNEERFLFDVVLTRATERLHLSYAQLNLKGEPNLPSFLLERAAPYETAPLIRVRPRPARQRAPEPVAAINSEELRQVLAERSAVLSASRIEQFLQCPFGLFGKNTLRLEEPPCEPWDRLNLAVQGNIAHEAFELHFRDQLAIREAFDRAFDRACAEERIPDGYRTEAVRLELRYSVELLARRTTLPRWSRSEFEQKFEIPLAEGLSLRGKIDRLEIDANGNALVIDYKYRNPERLKETVAKHEDRKAIQGGVYLIAAEALGYKPVGMVFAGFRERYSVRGWVQAPFAPELENSSSEAELRDRVMAARELAVATAQAIRDGRIAPKPEDDRGCWRCSYLKICRADAAPARRAVGGEE